MTIEPDAERQAALDEAIESAIYAFDAAGLASLIERYGVDPNRRLGPGQMPLLHMAIDAETDRGIGEPGYVPEGGCFEVLLQAGADPGSSYLGGTAADKVREASGLLRLQRILERFTGAPNERPS